MTYTQSFMFLLRIAFAKQLY